MKLFGNSRRQRDNRKNKKQRSQSHQQRRLRMESLENRRVLAANFIDITLVGDTIELEGDTNANQIEIYQDSRRGFSPSESFTIKAKPGSETMFRMGVDVIGDTYQSPISSAIENISIDFAQGGADEVDFIGKDMSATDESFLDGRLTVMTNGEAIVSVMNADLDSLFVSHEDDDDVGTTMLSSVTVRGDEVVQAGARSVYSTHIESGGGGSVITIANSRLQGGLSIANDGTLDLTDPMNPVIAANGTGAADVIMITDTDIGDRTVLDPTDVLEIYNGDGGSRTSLSRSVETDSSRIRGNVTINNGAGFDDVSFSLINIFGSSQITNGAGDFLHGSLTTISDGSVIGSDILGGGRLDVVNGDGDDRLVIEESQLPSGITVDNGNDGDTNTLIIGSASSTVRTVVGGNTLKGSAVQFANGSGNERITIANTDLHGLVDIGLGGGDDIVSLSDVLVNGILNVGNTEMFRPDGAGSMFEMIRTNLGLGLDLADDGDGGEGDDQVILENVTVTAGTFIGLGDDQDRVDLIDDIDFGPRAIIVGGNDDRDTLDRSMLSSVMVNVDFREFLVHLN